MKPIRTGLVSITFRQMDPFTIMALARQCTLDGVEWGADIHLIPGDLETSKKIEETSKSSSLIPLSYASYYKAGFHDPADFDQILKTAQILGTSRIRVWAGNDHSKDLSAPMKQRIVDDLLRISEISQNFAIEIGIEYHGNTYTDSVESTEELFLQLDQTPIFSYWQPPLLSLREQNVSDIQRLGRWIKMAHCFHWKWLPEEKRIQRLPLHEGVENWGSYLHALRVHSNLDTLSLEFLKDDSPAMLLNDTKTLHSLVSHHWFTSHQK